MVSVGHPDSCNVSVPTGTVEERQKIYEEVWVKFPKGLVPRRLPLTFLTGMCTHTHTLILST